MLLLCQKISTFATDSCKVSNEGAFETLGEKLGGVILQSRGPAPAPVTPSIRVDDMTTGVFRMEKLVQVKPIRGSLSIVTI